MEVGRIIKMKKISRFIFTIIFFYLPTSIFHLPTCYGAFIDPGWGTRGAGKGGAFIATADDASSIIWNPANLSLVYMKEFMFSYNKPYAGLEGININMGYCSVVYPVYGIANFGFAATLYNGDGVYRENSFQITAAKELSEVISRLNPMKLSAGLTVKYLTHKYIWDNEILSLNDPITENDSAAAISLDIGILFLPAYEFPIGISVKNLLPADVGLEYEDIVPVEVNLGAAYRLGAFGVLEDVTPEVKFGYRNQEYGDLINYAFGVETWLNLHTIGLRFGYNKNEIAFGTSFEKYLGSVGFRIDYAALISMSIGNNSGSHRISTSVKF